MRVYYPYRLDYVDKYAYLVVIAYNKEYKFLLSKDSQCLIRKE